MIFKLGELFCGPGGLGLGAAIASESLRATGVGIEHAWATDGDVASCDTYRNRFFERYPDRVIHSDIGRPDLFDELQAISDIQGLAFGFPCNDFSILGERKGANGKYGPLYSYGVEALAVFNPLWFIAENVRGLHQTNNAPIFARILQELEGSGPGYDVFPHLYRFEEYGVPQSRHRIIIVGLRKDQNLSFKIPSSKPFADIDVSAETALTVPPIKADAPNQELTRQSKTVIRRLEHTNPGQNAFSADLPDDVKLQIKGATLSQIYKRLDPSKPSYTVTGSGGGGTHVYHWSEPRALTNRERARLQTFPDDYEFKGTKEEVRRQIGMAVPPKGASVIFEAILKTFAGIDYESVPQNITPNRELLPLSETVLAATNGHQTADNLTPEQRRKNMANIRSRHTKPERLVRSLLHRLGFRFRLHNRTLPGKPDIILPRHRKIVLVDGCFWHMHDCKRGNVTPVTNSTYWAEKRARNVIRDKKNHSYYRSQGWKVLRVWECEIKDIPKLEKKLCTFMHR